jgi:hypothetical protein
MSRLERVEPLMEVFVGQRERARGPASIMLQAGR